MKLQHRLNSPEKQAATGLKWVATLIGAATLAMSATALADIPDAPRSNQFGGIYKVFSSTDPLFPATPTREYFLDFGKGIQMHKFSGNVAVSERRNPKVRVRIMAWQYFPDQGRIVLGNPFAEGSRNAVAKGTWRMRGVSNGFLFERGNYQIVLQTADPKDY